MAAYPQNTDSQESQVAKSSQSSSPTTGETGSGDATDITVRMWVVERPDRPVPLTWTAESVVVCMIADLVTTSRGTLAGELPTLMTAHFGSLAQALVAAKRIQTSILEFLTCGPGEGFGTAILLHPPVTIDPPGYKIEAVQQALGWAKPGQILLTEDLPRRAGDFPGIQLRAAASSSSVTSEVRMGLTELLWTTPERAALLQTLAAKVMDSPRHDDVPPVGATVMINSPFLASGRDVVPPSAPPIPQPAPALPVFAVDPAVPPQTVALDPVFANPTVPFSPKLDTQRIEQAPVFQAHSDDVPKPPLISEDLHDHAGGALTEGLDDERGPLFTRTRVIIGAVALALLAALIAVLSHPANVSKIPLPQPTVEEPRQVVTQKAAGRQAEAKAVQPPPKPAEPPKSGSITPTPPQTHSKPLADLPSGKKDKSPEPEPPTEVSGMSAKDIPTLLHMAQSNAGAGKYDEARREYKIILQLQPGNPDAKEGLRRLNLIQTDSDQQ